MCVSMCLYVCTYEYGCKCVSIYVHLEVRGWWSVFSSITVSRSFETMSFRFFHWTMDSSNTGVSHTVGFTWVLRILTHLCITLFNWSPDPAPLFLWKYFCITKNRMELLTIIYNRSKSCDKHTWFWWQFHRWIWEADSLDHIWKLYTGSELG